MGDGQGLHFSDLKGCPGDSRLVSALECASLPCALPTMLALLCTPLQKLLKQAEGWTTG